MKHFLFYLIAQILPFVVNAKIPYVSYEEAFYPDACHSNETGAIFQSFYNSYKNQSPAEEKYLIPKLIHFIWLGSEIPLKIMNIVETWKKWHPKWTVKIWTDEDIPSFGLQNQRAFDRAISFGEKSDIFRYEILYRFGGVYADIDFECLQPFDSLHQSCEFYTGVNRDNLWLLNGLIGAKPGHPVLKACIDNLKTDKVDYDAFRIMEQTGPYYFTRVFLATAPSCQQSKIAIFPPTFFYPLPNSISLDAAGEEKQRFVRPESMCIHYWSCSWMR